MGRLHYGYSAETYEFDDRTLSHLKVVILSKFRRSESFPFTWVDPSSQCSRTLWLNPAIPLAFTFDGVEVRELNRLWAETLGATANTAAGLTLVPEPEEPNA